MRKYRMLLDLWGWFLRDEALPFIGGDSLLGKRDKARYNEWEIMEAFMKVVT